MTHTDAPDVESSLERGLPISLSRNTDVAHWYMGWLRECVDRGWVMAPDPQQILPVRWSLDPDDVHSLFFWTKWSKHLREALGSWLDPYRVFVAFTITGWEEVETRVPSLDAQLDEFSRLVDLVGPHRVAWRYSPIPTHIHSDISAQARLTRTASRLSKLGIDRVDVSLMQPSPHWSEGYAPEGQEGVEERARRDALEMVWHVTRHFGIKVGVCADDARFLSNLPSDGFYATECVDRQRLDDAFDLDTGAVSECGCACQMTIDPCQGPQFGCASACEYCYVAYTKPPNSEFHRRRCDE